MSLRVTDIKLKHLVRIVGYITDNRYTKVSTANMLKVNDVLLHTNRRVYNITSTINLLFFCSNESVYFILFTKDTIIKK